MTLTNEHTLGWKRRLAANEQIDWRRLPWASQLAIVVATVANLIIYFVAKELGAIPESVTPVGDSPLSAGMVAGTSVVATNVATIAFLLTAYFSRDAVRLFRIIATVVLVLSFVSPATIPDAPVSMVLSLMAMHVVTWAASVGLLTIWARREIDE